jgi:hypothetical protein
MPPPPYGRGRGQGHTSAARAESCLQSLRVFRIVGHLQGDRFIA